jgi:hypothetical protein
VVVDDGSTDDSRLVIAGYGERILTVLKDNGGQASAFNAGFAACHGDIVIFLDADDLLGPDIAGRVVSCFRADAELVKVQYRLAVVDGDGRPTGELLPPPYQSLPAGDMRRQVLAFADDIPWLPTSGNAFTAEVLHRIMPVPEAVYTTCADYYLQNLPPLYGRIITLGEVGGYYRVHGGNAQHSAGLDLERTRRTVRLTCHTHERIKEAAAALGLSGNGRPVEPTGVTFVANRLVSLRLAPEAHPIPGDRPWRLAVEGVRIAFGRFDRPLRIKLLYALWFVAAGLAPRPLIPWLATRFFHPQTRPQLDRLLQS